MSTAGDGPAIREIETLSVPGRTFMKKIIFSGALLASLLSSAAAFAATELSMWYHGAGNEVEKKILEGIIADFNGSQGDYSIKIEQFPQESYNDSVTAAAASGKLPDIIDVDGPVMPGWAWAGYMAPLTVPADKYAKFLPGTIGTYNGKVYSIGLWDAAVALVGRKSVLNENGIRIPTLDKPWTMEEFDAALVKLQSSGKFEFPLDLGMAWKGEWYPYAFGPMMISAGGDIVNRDGYKTAEGTLNGEGAVKFGKWWQSVFARKLAPGTSQDGADRDSGFVNGKYALAWNGNWAALGIIDKYKDDVLFLPAPDFGNGSKIGAASWQFGVAASSKNQEGANKFIEFALQDKYLTAFSDGIGLIPPTPEAAAASKNYKAGGPMEVFYSLSAKQAVLRPVYPGYAVGAKVFEKALSDIANGADVQATLDAAADEVTKDIEKNGGYAAK
jgi:multiple sugar transport system substrate-binding protein